MIKKMDSKEAQYCPLDFPCTRMHQPRYKSRSKDILKISLVPLLCAVMMLVEATDVETKATDVVQAVASIEKNTPEDCANSTEPYLKATVDDGGTPPPEQLNCIVFNYTGKLKNRSYYFAHNVTFINSTITGKIDDDWDLDVTMKAAGAISFNNTKVNGVK